MYQASRKLKSAPFQQEKKAIPGNKNLQGTRVGDVGMHGYSSRPAQFKALADTQGRKMHMAPGPKEHLVQEAWHVMQQNQDRKSEGDCIQRKIKYCGKIYVGQGVYGDTNDAIGVGQYRRDGILKRFYPVYTKLQTDMNDDKKIVNLDKKVEDIDRAVLIKVENGYSPKNFFMIDNSGSYFLRQVQGQINYNIKDIIETSIKAIYHATQDYPISREFKNFHSLKVINLMKKDYNVLFNLPRDIEDKETTKPTGKNRNRFEYVMKGREIKRSGKGNHYIYRSMEPQHAKNLEMYWNGLPKPLPETVPDDFNLQDIGMVGHMGSFDQAFCTYYKGVPVEFEMEHKLMPASFVVHHNIAGLEGEASSGEGIGAANGKLGVKTESNGGNFSFGLPPKKEVGHRYSMAAKQVVWNFLRKVKKIKVYRIRPEAMD